MRNNKKQRKVLLLLIMLLTITVGFALLSTTLKINGTSTIKSNTWDIHWKSNSISVTSGSVEPPQGGDATIGGTNNDTVSFTANFDIPGDFYEFTVDAENLGTIDGAISEITHEVYSRNIETGAETKLTGTDIPSYIKFTYVYDTDNSIPKQGDILAANQSKKYRIRIEFDRSYEDLPEEAEYYTYKFHVDYQQHKGAAANNNNNNNNNEPETPAATSPVSITASKTNASVNEEVTITVSFTAATYNLHLSGAIADADLQEADLLVGGNLAAGNQEVTKTYTLSKSTPGTYTVTVTGDITTADNTTIDNISESVTITVA